VAATSGIDFMSSLPSETNRRIRHEHLLYSQHRQLLFFGRTDGNPSRGCW
jgi:hypothetical protein